MVDPPPGETDRRQVDWSRLRRILPHAIVVLAVGALAFSIWTVAAAEEPGWVGTSADVMAWAAVVGIVVMTIISRRTG